MTSCPARPRAHRRDLTEQQLRVLHLIAQGHSSREIARDLDLSYNTVKSYVEQILERLLARSRPHAVHIAWRDGLLGHQDGPHVRWAPGERFGKPHVHGISVDAITDLVRGEHSVDAAAHTLGLTRAEVLVACWHAARYGDPADRSEWGEWADAVGLAMAAGNYTTIPDPPTGGDQ